MRRKSKRIALRVIEHPLGGNGVEGYFYTDHRTAAGVAVDPDIPEFTKQACVIQAHGHHGRRPVKSGRKFMLEARDGHDLDPNAILAIRCVIEDLRPGWVEEVKDACRMFNSPRLIADWCELSVAVVVAIVDNLKARGEIPADVHAA